MKQRFDNFQRALQTMAEDLVDLVLPYRIDLSVFAQLNPADCGWDIGKKLG